MFLYVNYLLKIIFTYEKSILRCRYCYFHNLLHLKEYLKKKKKKGKPILQLYSCCKAGIFERHKEDKDILLVFLLLDWWT